MKIKNIKINGFGNLENKEIELKNGINLIYGKNETGKSTLLKFIYCMLFGASKNKNGKEISDFDKYLPWSGAEYSGKINYELDNKQNYEVFREFGKKNPKIYNDKLEDISKEFNINKTKGIEFFYEQTKIDEELFKNTILVEQGETKLDKAKQHTLIQKITNLISTGNDNISYKKAVEKLNKKLVEEVGSERTLGRPINIIEEKINKLENEKLEQEKNNEEIKYLEKEKIEIKQEINKQENKTNLIKKYKTQKENEKIENEKINTNNNIKKELEEKIEKLQIELDNKKEEKYKIKKLKYIILFVLILIMIILGIIIKNKIIMLASIIPVILFICSIIYDNINKNKINKKNSEEKKKIKSQINLINENKEKIEKDILEIKKQNTEKLNQEQMYLKNEFMSKLNLYEIENIFSKNYDEILLELEKEENILNNLKLKENTLNIEKKNLGLDKKNIEKINQELEEAKKERNKIKSLENSIKIAKEAMEIAYEKAKQNITPQFATKLSECVNQISTNKYQNVNFNDENGLRIELKNGDYVPVENLSTGTIDQMYLALRINSISEIVEEKLPIILDEAFAYYDDERMANILKYLEKEYKENQIIIFTCSQREEDVLTKLGIEYNKNEI